ncbi:hypothetical protein HDU96_006483 [Phlyctochytrium bullatum]|nr:hypothetical protein HDU96_006483 [Phlyctochytrium bullatum]
MNAAKDTVEALIKDNTVMVFSKSYCPYCRKAKSLLSSLKIDYKAIELDVEEDGDMVQLYLEKKTGQRTVPNIFIRGTQVGGCDALHDAHAKGKLKKLLEA